MAEDCPPTPHNSGTALDHRLGLEAPAWLLVEQDGLVTHLTHRPMSTARTMQCLIPLLPHWELLYLLPPYQLYRLEMTLLTWASLYPLLPLQVPTLLMWAPKHPWTHRREDLDLA